MSRLASFIVALTLSCAALPAAAHPVADWQFYEDPALGHRIELPYGRFVPAPVDPGETVQRLVEVDGDALLEVYGGENLEGLGIDAFADMLASADRIAEITYRTGGRTWFVLSGFYRRDGFDDQQLIFYAKFMFTRDLSRFAAFEISYPAAQRESYEALVERLEDSFRGPR
jgi:hypothetical protein